MIIKTKKKNISVSFYNKVQSLSFGSALRGFTIDFEKEFEVLSYIPDLFEPEDNLLLLSSENIIGAFLFNNEPYVVNSIRNYFESMIIDEIIYDRELTLNISFKLIIIDIGEENFRLIIEVNAYDYLVFLKK